MQINNVSNSFTGKLVIPVKSFNINKEYENLHYEDHEYSEPRNRKVVITTENLNIQGDMILLHKPDQKDGSLGDVIGSAIIDTKRLPKNTLYQALAAAAASDSTINLTA